MSKCGEIELFSVVVKQEEKYYDDFTKGNTVLFLRALSHVQFIGFTKQLPPHVAGGCLFSYEI